jgi:hypothetical protein
VIEFGSERVGSLAVGIAMHQNPATALVEDTRDGGADSRGCSGNQCRSIA